MRGDAKWATYLLVVALLTASVVVPHTVASPSDTETKRIAVGAAVPTPTDTPTTDTPRGPPPDKGPGATRPAISFVAICVAPDAPGGEVAIRPAESKEDDSNEPVAAEWRSTIPARTVVVNAGRRIERFAGGSGGTVVVGSGTPATGASPARPCPAGEDPLVKFERRNGEFVPETE